MKRIPKSIFALIFLCNQFGLAQQTQQSEPPTDVVTTEVLDNAAFLQSAIASPASREVPASRVNELLSKMTLREKIGQMTQLEIGMITSGKDQQLSIDPAKLQKAVGEYSVGSILNVHDEALDPSRWHEILAAIQASAHKTRLQIPVLYGIDSIHGANYVRGATLFPQPLAMAATWNPELTLRAAQITATETRAAHIPWDFSPVLDIGRQPLWPRLYETYGEDVTLASTMGVAMVRGYEGSDISSGTNVAACLKHYVGYSGTRTGQDRAPALLPEITLRQYYLPTFRAAVAAGAHTVMVNSGSVNGIPGHANKYLLTDVLRGEMKFQGIVVSDWEDIKRLVTAHHVAANEKEATRMAIMAGIDMSMVPSDYSFSDLLYQLVQEGTVPMSRIDEAVRRILTLKFELGLFNASSAKGDSAHSVGSPESRQVSLQAARESITLLKNEHDTLPFRKNARVLVTGPTADSLLSLNNGWTYTWQGDRLSTYPKDYLTLRQAIQAKVGAANTFYAPGTEINQVTDIDQAVQAARQADCVVLALGEGAYAEGVGDIPDLTLPQPQLQLAQAMIATGKPVALVLIEGRPRVISAIADTIPAIVMAYNPSNEGGQAIADVLFGDVNPSGRLPFTYPRYPNALLTYDRTWSELDDPPQLYKPQFEFGSGLSYTTFSYSNLVVAPSASGADQGAKVTVTVTNSGKRAGKEVVELYLSTRVASVAPPAKRLVRFAKIRLAPGASRNLSFNLTREDFSLIGPDLKPTVIPGDFEFLVGNLHAGYTITQSALERSRKNALCRACPTSSGSVATIAAGNESFH